MNTVIIGAGAVGGHYGAMLARAGHRVTFQARGTHLAQMQKSGLRIRTTKEDFLLSVDAVADASNIEDVELVLLAVKSYCLAEVAPIVTRLAARGAAVLPILNGVDVTERCVALGIPRTSLLAGIARVSVAKAAPGYIVQDTQLQEIALGELDGGISARAKAIAAAFENAGIRAELPTDIQLALWRKFVSLASRAALCAMSMSSGGNMAAVGRRPYGLELFQRAVREAGAVARACGVAFPTQLEDEICRDGNAPTEHKPSFVHDLERGGPTEIDLLSGTVSRLGRQTAVPTPVHDLACLLFAHTSAAAAR
jgi:2-dehydropantoate 2-reductase